MARCDNMKNTAGLTINRWPWEPESKRQRQTRLGSHILMKEMSSFVFELHAHSFSYAKKTVALLRVAGVTTHCGLEAAWWGGFVWSCFKGFALVQLFPLTPPLPPLPFARLFLLSLSFYYSHSGLGGPSASPECIMLSAPLFVLFLCSCATLSPNICFH